MKNGLSIKKLSIYKLTTKLLSTYYMDLYKRLLKSLSKSLVVELLIENIFIEGLGLRFLTLKLTKKSWVATL